jgi:hypothetical protein
MKRKITKSNVDFNTYIIDDTRKDKSIGYEKPLIVSKIYIENPNKKGDFIWSGKYDLEFDGETNLDAIINYDGKNLQIDVLRGESIRGTSTEYELDFECFHKGWDTSITKYLLDNPNFKSFLDAKKYLKNLSNDEKNKLIEKYGYSANRGYQILTIPNTKIDVIKPIKELGYNKDVTKSLAIEKRLSCYENKNFHVYSEDEQKSYELDEEKLNVITDGYLKENPECMIIRDSENNRNLIEAYKENFPDQIKSPFLLGFSI